MLSRAAVATLPAFAVFTGSEVKGHGVHLDRVPPCEGACVDRDFLEHVVAAASVVVTVPTTGQPSVALTRWILGGNGIDVRSSATSVCVPGQLGLQAMLRQPKARATFIDRDAVRKAIHAERYSLLLFFAHAPGRPIEPYCARELAIDWELLPFYAKRRAWLEERLTGIEHCRVSGTQSPQDFSPADQLQPYVSATGQCADGVKSGPWSFDHGADMHETGEYVAGRRVGTWQFRIGTSVVETTEYRDGRRQGRYLRTVGGVKDEDGQFADNLRIGTWRSWNEAGVITSEIRYRDGFRM